MDGRELLERPAETFPELLAATVARGPGDPFLVADDGPWTSFAEFGLAARRFAGGLVSRGIAKGDRVAILMDNRPEFLAATHGTLAAGAVCVPINSHLTPTEAGYVASHAEARVLVTEPRLLPRVRGIPRYPGLDLVVVAPAAGDEAGDGQGAPGETAAVATLPWAEFLADPVERSAGIRGDDLALIQYTSGTTAFPKGAMHSHRTLLTALGARARHLGYGPGDTMIVVTPLFHLNAQAVVFMALGEHFRVVLCRKFSASRFWGDVRRHRVTSFNGLTDIPGILLARDVEPGERVSSPCTVVGGIDAARHRAFESRFGVTLVTVYGLTEDPMPVLAPRGGFPPEWDDKLGSSGRPVDPAVHQIRIVDEAGRDLPPDQTGEIVKRSPATMLGYYKDPEATARVLRDGWLATGDLGYLDADGFLYVVGRKKDAMRRSGEMIAAAEVEAALGSHPEVAEVAVVGVPDPLRGQEVKAFVVLAAGRSPAEVPPAEILAHAARRLAPFKLPRYVEYRAELPRTATLKVRKEALRAGQEVQGPAVFDRERPGGGATP
ncbi:MAG TPA: AMP-binding protein [Thermoanaerobaculia bacterium]|nr:AMP-binding protein [Thermoanaerobaculia bacterium]